MTSKIIPKLHYVEGYNFELIKLFRQRQLKNSKNLSSLISVYKDKTYDHYYLDQLLNIITLYTKECNYEEILFWLKNDWNIKLKLPELKSILKKLSSRRLFTKTTKYYIIKDKTKIDGYEYMPDIIDYDNVTYTTNPEYNRNFLWYRDGGTNDEGSRFKVQIGNILSFLTYKNNEGELLSLEKILEMKRFCGAYNISDFHIIELYCELKKVKLEKNHLNKMLCEVQTNFIKNYLEVNKRAIL